MPLLLSWGANSYGQLGSGHLNDADCPQMVVLPFDANDILSISCGGGHVLVLLKNGDMYSCGSNSHGQLGQPSLSHSTIISTLSKVTLTEMNSIYYICAGWGVSIACRQEASETHVFCWGANNFGECGVDPGLQTTIVQPNIFKIGGIVVKISCGLRHTLLLTSSGILYSWGCNRRKQLGRSVPNLENDNCAVSFGIPHFFPGKVMLPQESGIAMDCVAGEGHSAALTENGRVFVWGDNRRGQCGLAMVDELHEIFYPKVAVDLPLNVHIREIASGWSHLLAVSEEGTVFAWGRSDYGQTSNYGDVLCSTTLPHEVKLESASKIFCTSEHSMALSKTAKSLYSWGWNEHGLCGIGQEYSNLPIINTPMPVSISLPHEHCNDTPAASYEILRVFCGAGFCWIIVQKDKI